MMFVIVMSPENCFRQAFQGAIKETTPKRDGRAVRPRSKAVLRPKFVGNVLHGYDATIQHHVESRAGVLHLLGRQLERAEIRHQRDKSIPKGAREAMAENHLGHVGDCRDGHAADKMERVHGQGRWSCRGAHLCQNSSLVVVEVGHG